MAELGQAMVKMAGLTHHLMGIFLLSCLVSWAGQGGTVARPGGSIAGTVVDPSGAVIPAVSVMISNPQSGLQQVIATDSEGLFESPKLPPGRYQVEVRQSGFNPLVESNLRVKPAKSSAST